MLYNPDKLGPIINSTDATEQPKGQRDTKISTRRIGGPLTGLDVRMFIGAATLEHLLAVARSSSVSQVHLNRVGIVAETWIEEGTGHEYEIWKFVSDRPVPARNDIAAAAKAAADNGFTR